MYLHLDMDYFFAQAEEKRRPMMQGKIIVVCVYSGRTADSGVVSTVNYAGRAVGIHSGMPIFMAKKRAPPADTLFLPVDHDYYARVSAQIDAIIRRAHSRVVQASIDEWNVELETDDVGVSEAQGKKLKEDVKTGSGLACTVGVAPSMLGAKMAAARAKPDGLLVLDRDAERKFVMDSDVEKVPGIGPKTALALNEIGVGRVKDLAKFEPITLVEIFGRKAGAWLHALGQGVYAEGLGEEKGQEEVSRIGTLKEKTRDAYMLLAKLDEMEADAKEWLAEMKKSYKTLSITFITEDLRTHSKSTSFHNPRTWNEDITKEKKELVDDFLKGNRLDVRRIGIKFGNFLDLDGQTTLF
jgi:DNA polymerase IV (archaeal DinB-like DNA polymerase)